MPPASRRPATSPPALDRRRQSSAPRRIAWHVTPTRCGVTAAYRAGPVRRDRRISGRPYRAGPVQRSLVPGHAPLPLLLLAFGLATRVCVCVCVVLPDSDHEECVDPDPVDGPKPIAGLASRQQGPTTCGNERAGRRGADSGGRRGLDAATRRRGDAGMRAAAAAAPGRGDRALQRTSPKGGARTGRAATAGQQDPRIRSGAPKDEK